MTATRLNRYFLHLLLAVAAAVALALAPASAEASSDLKLGVYLPDPWGDASNDSIDAFESRIGRNVEVYLYYYDMYSDPDLNAYMYPIISGHRILLIAWEPWHRGVGNDPPCNYTNFMSGAYDAQIRNWARKLRDVGGPVMFKPLSEMNGDWACWGGTVNGNTPEQFKQVWSYMRGIFAAEGATNVIWVFGPNRDWTTQDATSTFDLYYPGDDVVDFIGFSGYNWGGVYDWSFWQNFESVFAVSYDVAAARSMRPILASETAAPESGGNKALWITDMFNILPTRFPRMKIVVWFNIIQNEPDMLPAGADWRINSSTSSLLAYRTAAASLGQVNMSLNYNNTCSRPGLENAITSPTYWASYSDFLSRHLSVNYICRNDGTVNAYDVAVTGSDSTHGVKMLTPMPRTLGILDTGQSATYTLQYEIPAGVETFVTKTKADAKNFCGTVYNY
jgi:hypothetical protein